jgi:hypothetical protein
MATIHETLQIMADWNKNVQPQEAKLFGTIVT